MDSIIDRKLICGRPHIYVTCSRCGSRFWQRAPLYNRQKGQIELMGTPYYYCGDCLPYDIRFCETEYKLADGQRECL